MHAVCLLPLLLLLAAAPLHCVDVAFNVATRTSQAAGGSGYSASVTVSFPPKLSAADVAAWRDARSLLVQLTSGHSAPLQYTAHEEARGPKWTRFAVRLRAPGSYQLNVTELRLRRARKSDADHREVTTQLLQVGKGAGHAEALAAGVARASLPRCLDVPSPSAHWFGGAWALPSEPHGASPPPTAAAAASDVAHSRALALARRRGVVPAGRLRAGCVQP
jgi:hypothetical protein